MQALRTRAAIYLVLVARAGVQPATFALGVRRSMHLSYRAAFAGRWAMPDNPCSLRLSPYSNEPRPAGFIQNAKLRKPAQCSILALV